MLFILQQYTRLPLVRQNDGLRHFTLKPKWKHWHVSQHTIQTHMIDSHTSNANSEMWQKGTQRHNLGLVVRQKEKHPG